MGLDRKLSDFFEVSDNQAKDIVQRLDNVMIELDKVFFEARDAGLSEEEIQLRIRQKAAELGYKAPAPRIAN